VPGFDDPEPVETAETTTWLHRDAGRDVAGQAEKDSSAGDGADAQARSDDARRAGEKPGEDAAGAVSASAAGSSQVDSGSEPESAAADETAPGRPGESADADTSASQDDDSEPTADVTGRPSGTDADADSTVAISRNELRQALPQQGTPADGEKTQVIRVRRDDGPAT
jgi:hypothetical protein